MSDYNTNIVSLKKTLLIIDGNAETRKNLIQLFTGIYTIYSTDSNSGGVKLIKKYQPDVVIANVCNDAITTVTLCKTIKENDTLNHVALLLLSNTDNTQIQLEAILNGADDFIIYPYNSEIIVARVAALLLKREQLRRYYLNAFTVTEATNTISDDYKAFLTKCIKVVEANIENENFSMKIFSQAMGISYSVLYKKIKTICGQTVNAFIRGIRLHRAALMMLTENVNIAQAGLQVGIENQKYFRQQFVKLFGLTPSEYIKKNRNKSDKKIDTLQFIIGNKVA